MFFFEKKNQKTFGPLREAVERSWSQTSKIFCLFCQNKEIISSFLGIPGSFFL
jgi:hypothetical protein